MVVVIRIFTTGFYVKKIKKMVKPISLSAKFVIRNGRTPCIYYRNKRFSLNISISDEKEFDLKTGKLTHHYRGTDREEINLNIQKRFQSFNALITQALADKVDTLEYLSAHFEKADRDLKKLNIDNSTTISFAYENWIAEKEKGIIVGIGRRSSERYYSQLSRIKDFEKTNKTKLHLIDMNWIKDYAVFLATPFEKSYNVIDKINEREYKSTKILKQTNTTIQRGFKDLVSFLKAQQEIQPEFKFPIVEINKYINSLDCAFEDNENITVLSRQQWIDYKEYEPREKFPWEVKTYDLFRFCCNTGLRYSDAIRLNDEYIINGNQISMKAQKTRNKFSVVMNEDAFRIYNKYHRDFRKKFPVNQQINFNLTKLLKKIPSFCETVDKTVYTLNKMETQKIPFYEKISFHDSRKTFVSFIITNHKTDGKALELIMRFTGWTDTRTLKHYLQVFGDEHYDKDSDAVNEI